MKFPFPLVAALVCAAMPAFAVPVTVTAVDPDGKPLPGATLRAAEMNGRFDYKAEQGDRAGRDGVFSWEFDGEFGFTPTDFDDTRRLLRVRVAAPGKVTDNRVLRAGQTTIVLYPAREWSGLVLDAEQKPIVGAKVEATNVRPPLAPGEKLTGSSGVWLDPYLSVADAVAISDAAGRWKMADLPARGSASLKVAAPGYAAQRVEMAIGEGNALPIYLKRAGAATGVVLKPDGSPIAGAKVRVNLIGFLDRVVTDEAGRFTIEGMEPGFTTIGIGDFYPSFKKGEPLDSYLFTGDVPVRVEAGKTTDVGEIRAVTGVLVSARIVDAVTRMPLEGAIMRLGFSGSLPRESDEKGELQTRIRPATMRQSFEDLTVEVEGYPTYKVPRAQLAAPGETLDLGTIALQRGGVVAGRVRVEGADTGGRLPEIFLRSEEGQYDFVKPDGNGQFKSKPLGASEYRLSPRDKDNWQIVAPRTITLAESEAQNKPVEIVVKRLTPFLPQLREVRGRLLDSDGQGVAGAKIEATWRREGGATSNASALTDANGDYVLSADAPETIGVEIKSVEHPAYFVSGEAQIALQNGVATVTGFAAKKRGSIVAGRVVGKDGQAAAGAWVTILEARDFTPVQSAADGSFRLVDVPLDSFTLLAARGRDWAQLATTSEVRNARITLSNSTPVETREAALARLVGIKSGVTTTVLFDAWSVLGAENTERYIRRNGIPDDGVMASFGGQLAYYEPAMFLARAPEFLQAAQGEEREDLEARLGLIRARIGDADARSAANAWLDEQKGIKREINARSVTQLLKMAATARALKRADAPAWIDYAAALADQLGRNTPANLARWYYGMDGLDYDSIARFAADFDAPAEFSLWFYGAAVLAREDDFAGASKALARMETLLQTPAMEQVVRDAAAARDPAPTRRLDGSRIVVATELARADAPAAFELADQIEDAAPRVRVMLRVADAARRAGQNEVAQRAAREVFKARSGNVEYEALAAAIGAQISPRLGDELFALAYEKALPELGRRQRLAPPSIGAWALYHAPYDPAQSRVLIEQEWAWRVPAAVKDKDRSYSQEVNALYDLVKGMAAVDAARAAQMLAIADGLEAQSYGRKTTQFDIAVIALATPEQRARLGVDARF